jgi:hypothetical protein
MPMEMAGCVGREYYACRPDGLAVVFEDLPEATREKLEHRRVPSFTAVPGKGMVWNMPGVDQAELRAILAESDDDIAGIL